jgi:hypothetical protein
VSDVAADARVLLAALGVDAGGDATPERLAALLAGAETHAPSRDARRDIRRMLYRLAQGGAAAPARPADDEERRPALGATIEGLVSAVDGRGDRLVWLVRDEPAGGVLLVAADVNEPDGLQAVRVVETTRKQLRAMRERLQAEAAVRLVPADWRALDALVVEAADRRGEKPERALDYRRLRARMTSVPPAPPHELVSTHVAPPAADEQPALVADSAALRGEPELRTWWPTPERAAPFLDEIRGLDDSPIVLGRVQSEERLRAVLARAAVALYPPAPTARRLEATAYVLAETGRAEAARRALAVAAALRADPERAPDVPLVAALVQQGLGSYLASGEAAQREERSQALVLTPGEALRARSRGRPPRAGG